MPCLNDISLRETGLISLNFARSTKAITAYLPLDVSFIGPYFSRIYINLTKLVKYLTTKKNNILSRTCDMSNFFLIIVINNNYG